MGEGAEGKAGRQLQAEKKFDGGGEETEKFLESRVNASERDHRKEKKKGHLGKPEDKGNNSRGAGEGRCVKDKGTLS